jgi:hypothetical protein
VDAKWMTSDAKWTHVSTAKDAVKKIITAKDAVKKIITSKDAVSILNYLSNCKLPKSFFILISTCKYVL